MYDLLRTSFDAIGVVFTAFLLIDFFAAWLTASATDFTAYCTALGVGAEADMDRGERITCKSKDAAVNDVSECEPQEGARP